VDGLIHHHRYEIPGKLWFGFPIVVKPMGSMHGFTAFHIGSKSQEELHSNDEYEGASSTYRACPADDEGPRVARPNCLSNI
jgi:hypothetical protein